MKYWHIYWILDFYINYQHLYCSLKKPDTSWPLILG